jgi:hypothetical protein
MKHSSEQNCQDTAQRLFKHTICYYMHICTIYAMSEHRCIQLCTMFYFCRMFRPLLSSQGYITFLPVNLLLFCYKLPNIFVSFISELLYKIIKFKLKLCQCSVYMKCGALEIVVYYTIFHFIFTSHVSALNF